MSLRKSTENDFAIPTFNVWALDDFEFRTRVMCIRLVSEAVFMLTYLNNTIIPSEL